ncbi:MAG: hydantoinase B/oxoprolinase family protein [Actinomycetes bacterium]
MSSADPIALELLRQRLEAIAEEAATTIERTAISPVVTEGKDYSATLLDGAGRLVAGGGTIAYHFRAAAHAVQSTLAAHGGSIVAGDVFLANDPHHGGGLHPQDVMVQRPIFSDGVLVAWVALSAHLMDMGGMAPGSFAPAATDCYQEAIRLPPVRIFRAGEEVTDVWDVFLNNVRLPDLVGMDLRGLVAGAHVAALRVAEVVDAMGPTEFGNSVDALCALSEREFRRRIALLEDGAYRATTWTEWEDEFLPVVCALTVDGDRLVFDYTGTAEQAPHFFNTKPFIVESAIMTRLSALVAADLPYTHGLFEAIEVHCPDGSLVGSKPPAPIAAAHIHVALNAAEGALQCVRLAAGASPDSPARGMLTGWGGSTALGLSVWAGTGLDGNFDTWIMLDGSWPGSSAGHSRDGIDLSSTMVGTDARATFQDVEVLEAWYPMLITGKRYRTGVGGAGAHRSGGGTQMGLTPHGPERLTGEMLASRQYLPLQGAAGGRPGVTTALRIHRADGSSERVSTSASGVTLRDAEVFEFACASGGGFGDPLDRDPAAVALDVVTGRLSADDAIDAYAVVTDAAGNVDEGATARARSTVRRDRLQRARPARKPVADAVALPSTGAQPLYPGVVQRGHVAVAAASGAPLAFAPDHWTDGCPVIEERYAADGPDVTVRTYLDPRSGAALHVEAVPHEDVGRSFAVLPQRWTAATR